jgi:hypothetical protein
MQAKLNEKSLLGIREGGKDILLRNYKEFEKIDSIQIGKDTFRITARMEISEDLNSRIHLQLMDYSNRVFTASVIPSSDGKNTFLKFGNKMLGNPSLFLMNLLPTIHLLTDLEKAEIMKGLSRELTESEKEEKRISELYNTWFIDQVNIQKRSPSKIESKSEWYETVYQSVLEEMEVKKIQEKERSRNGKKELVAV